MFVQSHGGYASKDFSEIIKECTDDELTRMINILALEAGYRFRQINESKTEFGNKENMV